MSVFDCVNVCVCLYSYKVVNKQGNAEFLKRMKVAYKFPHFLYMFQYLEEWGRKEKRKDGIEVHFRIRNWLVKRVILSNSLLEKITSHSLVHEPYF